VQTAECQASVEIQRRRILIEAGHDDLIARLVLLANRQRQIFRRNNRGKDAEGDAHARQHNHHHGH
jgi:hypothetical protein